MREEQEKMISIVKQLFERLTSEDKKENQNQENNQDQK